MRPEEDWERGRRRRKRQETGETVAFTVSVLVSGSALIWLLMMPYLP